MLVLAQIDISYNVTLADVVPYLFAYLVAPFGLATLT